MLWISVTIKNLLPEGETIDLGRIWLKSSWCGNGLEVVSGRAGPRAARAAPRAHAEAKIGLGLIWPKSNGSVITL